MTRGRVIHATGARPCLLIPGKIVASSRFVIDVEGVSPGLDRAQKKPLGLNGRSYSMGSPMEQNT